MLPSHCFGEQCEGSMAYLGKGLDFRPRVFSYGSDVAHARSCTGRPGSVFLRVPAVRVLGRRLKRGGRKSLRFCTLYRVFGQWSASAAINST